MYYKVKADLTIYFHFQFAKLNHKTTIGLTAYCDFENHYFPEMISD